MTDTPTLAGLASELADALARIARMESMTAHPAWCVPLTEDEERATTAESGPVRPCEPRKGGDAPTDPQPPEGPQNGAERLPVEPLEAIRNNARFNTRARYAFKRALMEAREARGLTAEKVAERMGVDVAVVRSIEQHQAEDKPTLEAITRYATAIDAQVGFSISLPAINNPAEPLTEEPPVGTQVVDGFGNLWENLTGGWTRWEFRGWAFGSHVGAGRAWSSMAAPLRLATDADRERVDLPRDHWPSAESDAALDELRQKLTAPVDPQTVLGLLDEIDRLRLSQDYTPEGVDMVMQQLHDVRAERDALKAQVERVRYLHQRNPVYALADDCLDETHDHFESVDGDLLCANSPTGEASCRECFQYGADYRWPCPTIRALDGGTDE